MPVLCEMLILINFKKYGGKFVSTEFKYDNRRKSNSYNKYSKGKKNYGGSSYKPSQGKGASESFKGGTFKGGNKNFKYSLLLEYQSNQKMSF